jgi:hypothetical protein
MSPLNTVSPRVRTLLEAFFGPGNRFQLVDIEGGKLNTARLQPWVARLTGPEPLPTVLPCWRGKEVDWYAIAPSEAQARALGEELAAFIGTSYSTFRGPRAVLDLNDPIEAAVHAFSGGAAFKFIGRRDAEGKFSELWDALEAMRRVWDRRIHRAPELPRPTGRVLRDFEMALQARDRASAEADLAYMADHNRLDALNLLFLRTRMLVVFDTWNDVFALRDLPQLLTMRRPLAVTHALVRAVYHRELAAFEHADDAAGAVHHFHERVLPTYGNLFAARAGMNSPEAMKAFMLLAVGPNPRPHLREEILATASGAERPYLVALAGLSDAPVPPPPIDPQIAAEEAEAQGDYDMALRWAHAAPSSRRQAQVLLVCALELQTLDAERAALACVDALDEAERKVLLASRLNREFLARLRGQSEAAPAEGRPAVPPAHDPVATATIPAAPVPTDWATWLIHLHANPDWARAGLVAAQGAQEWSVETFMDNPEATGAFAQLLPITRPSQTDAVVHQALPHMLAFFQRDLAWPRPAGHEIYRLMLDLLAVSTEGGDPDLALFNELAEVELSLGVSAGRYEEMLDFARDIWGRVASPVKVDWALDWLDVLVRHACPVLVARTQMLHAVVDRMRLFARRVEPGQWAFLRLLIDDLGEREALADLFEAATAPEEADADPITRMKDRTVLIYTLTEAVGVRVKAILEDASPGVTVHLSHDHDGSDRLKQLARNGDIVVVATQSAKHAATTFIEAHLGDRAALLRPAGKGSASMLREIRRHLAS